MSKDLESVLKELEEKIKELASKLEQSVLNHNQLFGAKAAFEHLYNEQKAKLDALTSLETRTPSDSAVA